MLHFQVRFPKCNHSTNPTIAGLPIRTGDSMSFLGIVSSNSIATMAYEGGVLSLCFYGIRRKLHAQEIPRPGDGQSTTRRV